MYMKSSNWNHRLSQLEEKLADGTITEAEAIEYADWYNEGQDEIVEIPYSFAASEEEHKTRLLQNIDKEIDKRSGFSIGRIAAAAVLLATLLVPLYYLSHEKRLDRQAVVSSENQRTDIPAGRTKASLRLADGQMLLLDSAADGLIAKQGGVNVLLSHGGLAYEKQAHEAQTAYNTLFTRNGEQYSLTLSDGTRVWLNAASSLRFPVEFTGRERRVELSGEGYFEVAKEAGRSFYVTSNGQEVQVLGTHFDVDGYVGHLETTLLEGRVRVNGKTVLSPGQQSRLKNGRIAVKNDVDVDAVIAWKDGRFNFNNADISDIMQQLERWYDIQVVFQGRRTTDLFYGTIPRSASLEQVLRMLQNSRVHFDLQGRRLVLLP
jgi:transmembrane sensor